MLQWKIIKLYNYINIANSNLIHDMTYQYIISISISKVKSMHCIVQGKKYVKRLNVIFQKDCFTNVGMESLHGRLPIHHQSLWWVISSTQNTIIQCCKLWHFYCFHIKYCKVFYQTLCMNTHRCMCSVAKWSDWVVGGCCCTNYVTTTWVQNFHWEICN